MCDIKQKLKKGYQYSLYECAKTFQRDNPVNL